MLRTCGKYGTFPSYTLDGEGASVAHLAHEQTLFFGAARNGDRMSREKKRNARGCPIRSGIDKEKMKRKRVNQETSAGWKWSRGHYFYVKNTREKTLRFFLSYHIHSLAQKESRENLHTPTHIISPTCSLGIFRRTCTCPCPGRHGKARSCSGPGCPVSPALVSSYLPRLSALAYDADSPQKRQAWERKRKCPYLGPK